MKKQRRTTTKTKRPRALKLGGRRKPSSTNANTENALLKRERDEALEQQKATAEVLRVISRSTFDLQFVFNTLVASAARLCEADHAFLFVRDGEVFRLAANHSHSREFDEFFTQHPIPIDRGSLTGRTAMEAKVVHIPDALHDPEYTMTEVMKLDPFRSMLGVPLLREGNPIGVFSLTRAMVRPFAEKQIELVSSFAAQAVIAIENTRLLNELRQRTSDLTESLEQQTATSEVLKVISSSPGDLEPVFQTMLENATRICEAKFGTLFRFDGKYLHPAAQFNTPLKLLEALTRRGAFQPTRGTPIDLCMQTKQVSHTADDAAAPIPGLAAKLGGARSLVAVPMLKDEALVGDILIYRQEVRPFTEKQIALVQNFAAQAVIAIENTRLLNELRQRTTDLTESLERQTATSEVLKVISSSPGNLEAVFQAMLENAIRICDARFGTLLRFDGNAFHLAAGAGHSAKTRRVS